MNPQKGGNCPEGERCRGKAWLVLGKEQPNKKTERERVY